MERKDHSAYVATKYLLLQTRNSQTWTF